MLDAELVVALPAVELLVAGANVLLAPADGTSLPLRPAGAVVRLCAVCIRRFLLLLLALLCVAVTVATGSAVQSHALRHGLVLQLRHHSPAVGAGVDDAALQLVQARGTVVLLPLPMFGAECVAAVRAVEWEEVQLVAQWRLAVLPRGMVCKLHCGRGNEWAGAAEVLWKGLWLQK